MEAEEQRYLMPYRMVRMLLTLLCVGSAVMAHAQGNVSTLPATTRGSFEFSVVMYYSPPDRPWYPTLQSACEAQAVYLSGLRNEWAGAYCHKTFLVPENINGYWYASIAFPNWVDWKLAVETVVVYPRVICPSGYGGNYEWDYTTTPRTMVPGCLRLHACPANSTGVPVNYPTTCTCNAGYAPDQTGTSCVPNTLSLTLTGGTTTEPGTSLGFVATVTNQDKQPPANPVKVKISLKVDPTSGGHAHGDGTRPRGGIEGKKCSSDETCWEGFTNNGVVNFNFNPTDASGTHTITATCEGCSNTETKIVDVKVKESDAAGWDSLSESPSDYELIGDGEGKNHHDNHYLTETARDHLQAIYDTYNEVYPEGPVLHLNDASLVWGGKFDISGKWVGYHYEHLRGKEIDMRANQEPTAISFWRFNRFKKIASDNGASASVHCSFPAKYSWACWFDMGEKRHFHVRLTGR